MKGAKACALHAKVLTPVCFYCYDPSRLRAAIEAWVAADRACEELLDSEADIMPVEEFNARTKALHAAQDGLYAAIGAAQ